jgi:hypothetical protein
MRTVLTAVLVSLLCGPFVVGAPALASHGGGGIRNHGGCSGTADWNLKAHRDDGRIEVEAEVDSNRSGQVWTWTLRHNGSLSSHGSATTRGASGSFSIERRMADLAGTDHFAFRAERRATGQVCRGTISL